MGNSFVRFVSKTRMQYIGLLSALFLTVNLITRVVLQVSFPDMTPFSGDMFPGLAKGFLNDTATLFFVLLFPASLLLLPKDTFMAKRAGRIYAAAVFFIFSSIFVFTAFAEYFFWEEFSSRFNFIAVDYLIYTTELVQNIVESYPLPWLLLAVFILAVGSTLGMMKLLRGFQGKLAEPAAPGSRKAGFGARLAVLGGLYLGSLLLFVFFTPFAGGESRFWNEYAKNGVYEIFSAYLHNQLDYRAFYKTMDRAAAFSVMRDEIKDAGERFETPQGENLVRMLDSHGPEKKPNVIVVIMESMGSKLLGEYTPNLNSLAAGGLSFTNMLSTGTRTVRGIEAVMLSVPPTPGNSIVRRPGNDRLFNLGTMFRNRGYDLSFIYGGIGFFDNMNSFFADNGYGVTDKADFFPENRTFSNAWGQCDEDLYSQSLAQADKSHAAGRPFQQVLLTTSNHRPFTYPEGKVALSPGSGRKGAIQYSDYAIGQFMKQAGKKPWFDNTVFVFVGDHPSSIAGKTEVPADAYGIACIMYGPRFFKPERIDTLCSQIDVAPTLLASLGWGYTSQFFGTDARSLPQESGRAWISTYQLLGFRTNNRLVVLGPDGLAKVTDILPQTGSSSFSSGVSGEDGFLVDRAVASYQCAYDLFVEKQMKEAAVQAYSNNLQYANSQKEKRDPGQMEPAGNASPPMGSPRNGLTLILTRQPSGSFE